ncbi:MAG: carboxypeptidase regulatory-like domain-containing protein [Bacteroidales bacterium]|nr:carboxypeptidase regulatory-like domain-containing protein [Bacteroidales bacterium]
MKKFLLFGMIGLTALFFYSCAEVGSIDGYVSLDEEYVEDATVKIYYTGETALIEATSTDDEGYFEFNELVPGTYDVTATYEQGGSSYTASVTEIPLIAGEYQKITLELEK